MGEHKWKASVSVPEKYLECLQTRFGHSEFYEEQWEVISSILNDSRDNFLGLRPGYGKSLCYQFPSVYLNTVTMVISPFISLMKDQVNSLVKRGIPACLLGTGQEKGHHEIMNEVFAGMYNIVYMAPECAIANKVLNELKDRVTLIAVDDAYFITKWGFDFRLDYRSLNAELRTTCPQVPILAIASPATKKVRNDVIETLQMDNPGIYLDDIDRPNLEFIVKEISDSDAWADIGPYLDDVSESVIIKCLTKAKADEIKKVLIDNGVKCDVYHSDVLMNARTNAQEDFMSGHNNVIIATACFGTGLDKSDVHLIIHYGVADDVETYYQQIGIAGRDGKPTKCVVFYDPSWSEAPFPKSDIKMYVTTNECRRRFILTLFEEDCSKLTERPDCCDICTKRKLEGIKTED